MGTAALVREDPMLRLRYYQETGQDDEAKLYERYLRETGQFTTPTQAKLRKEHAAGILDDRIARENLNDAEMAEAETPSYASQALGGIASLARDIPGAEAAQAGSRSLVRTALAKAGLPVQAESYGEARRAIRGAEDSAPSFVRNYNRIAGGALAAAGIPGAPVLQGARYGMSEALLQSDPDANVEERLHDATAQGAAGAAFGAIPAIGRGIKHNFPVARDVALAPFMSGARRRLVNRAVGAFNEAAPVRSAAPGVASVPPVEGLQSIGEAIGSAPVPRTAQAPKSLFEVARLPAAPTTTTAPTAVAPKTSRDAAARALQGLLQSKLDEESAEIAAKTAWEEASNPELMRRIEESLLRAKAQRHPTTIANR